MTVSNLATATAVFLAHHDSMVAACCLQISKTYCHRSGDSLKLEGKAAHTTITVFLIYLGSMVVACCAQSGTLSSVSALMLLVG